MIIVKIKIFDKTFKTDEYYKYDKNFDKNVFNKQNKKKYLPRKKIKIQWCQIDEIKENELKDKNKKILLENCEWDENEENDKNKSKKNKKNKKCLYVNIKKNNTKDIFYCRVPGIKGKIFGFKAFYFDMYEWSNPSDISFISVIDDIEIVD